MRLHLRCRLRTRRERGDRDDLARPPIEHVAREDVAEKVRLQVFVELRMEVEDGSGDRPTAEFRLVVGTDFNGPLAEKKRRII